MSQNVMRIPQILNGYLGFSKIIKKKTPNRGCGMSIISIDSDSLSPGEFLDTGSAYKSPSRGIALRLSGVDTGGCILAGNSVLRQLIEGMQ